MKRRYREKGELDKRRTIIAALAYLIPISLVLGFLVLSAIGLWGCATTIVRWRRALTVPVLMMTVTGQS